MPDDNRWTVEDLVELLTGVGPGHMNLPIRIDIGIDSVLMRTARYAETEDGRHLLICPDLANWSDRFREQLHRYHHENERIRDEIDKILGFRPNKATSCKAMAKAFGDSVSGWNHNYSAERLEHEVYHILTTGMPSQRDRLIAAFKEVRN